MKNFRLMHAHALILFLVIATKTQTCLAYRRRGTGGTTRIIPENVIVEIFDPNQPGQPLQRINTSGSAFGPLLPFGREEALSDNTADGIGLPIYHTPRQNPLLCNDVSEEDKNVRQDEPFILMIPRGSCTFERKVANAQKMGAYTAMIYNNLSSRYDLNYQAQPRSPTTSPTMYPTHIVNGSVVEDVTNVVEHLSWPQDKFDYDCNYGQALMPLESFSFIPSSLSRVDGDKRLIYDGSINDALLTGLGEENLCLQYEKEEKVFESSCASQRCLLTGELSKQQDVFGFEVVMVKGCCAWDISFNLHYETEKILSHINIPSVFLTMEQGDNLLEAMDWDGTNSRQLVTAIIYERAYPKLNMSSIFLCIFGTWVTWIASYHSAKPYRDARIELETIDIDLGPSGGADALPMESVSTDSRGNDINRDTQMDTEGGDLELTEVTAENDDTERHTQRESDANTNANVVNRFSHAYTHSQDTLELRGLHALTFVVIAASLLFLLFFTRIYGFVTVLYAIAGTTAIAQVIFEPAFNSLAIRICPQCISWYGTICRSRRRFKVYLTKGLSYMCSYGVGFLWVWYYYSFELAFLRPFYWIIQDIMGMCICIVFFDFVRLNNIQVATFFLVAFFMYDIFFVFATYLIFEQNIMSTVALGGPDIADKIHCTKYPDHDDCGTVSPLPMLLAIPSIGDYIPSMSMLGLGDIILPGLLISFAARLDAAKKLVNTASIRTRAASEGVRDVSNLYRKRKFWSRIYSGYFYRAILAYGSGLLLSLIVSHILQQPQPALMYLIPLTIATIAMTGRRKHEFNLIWIGHKALPLADEVVREISYVGAARFGVDPMDDLSIYTASSHTLSEDGHGVM